MATPAVSAAISSGSTRQDKQKDDKTLTVVQNTQTVTPKTPTLQDKAFLVELHISCWTARREDKNVTQDTNQRYNASSDAGQYRKALLPKKALDKLRSIAGEIRKTHYSLTLPWSDQGARILPAKMYHKYITKLDQLKNDYKQALEDFIVQYPTYVAQAATTLGNMYDQSEYPNEQDLRTKFYVNHAVNPVPYKDDFRVAISDEEKETLAKAVEQRVLAAQANAQTHLAQRLGDAVQKMAEKLKEQKPVFRDTLVGNLKELVDLLPGLNVTENPELKAIGDQIEKDLCMFTPKDLRTDEKVRNETAKKAEELFKKIQGFQALEDVK